MKRKLFNHKLSEADHEEIKKHLAEQTPVYIIARKMKVDRHVLADYIKSHDELMAAQNDRDEAFKDSVEYELQRKILVEHNLNAIMFYADRRMRDRGYGEHIENEQTGGLEGTVVFGEISEDDMPSEMPVDEGGGETPPPMEPVPQDQLPDEGETQKPKGMF
jgi:hypothetical protein